MIQHLTEDQISRWFVGQSSATDQRHVQGCGPCTAELGRFLDTLESFKAAVTSRAEKLTHRASPSLAVVLESQTVTTLGGRDMWSKDEFRHTRWLSLVVHAVVLGLLVIPTAIVGPRATQTIVSVYRNTPLALNLPRQTSGGGGGGGRKSPTPPSKGVLPRGADKQIVPPLVEPKNLLPDVVVESTVLVPQLANIRPLNLQLGDPNGVVGPPSAGPGTGGGIGTGNGTGVGPGIGPGVGPGRFGGIGGNVFNVGGGVTEPVLASQVQPEYSDDGRKARVQGTVELLIIVQSDGTVVVDDVRKSLGYGLDQRAIDAVRKWRFIPGKKDGVAVATYVSVLVNFSLR